MSIDIAASLNERQCNALLSYYLGQYIPASGNDDLVDLVQTPEDVYEYLLIDPLVSNAVPTSRVAQAMSSIQQYINGITMNMEPGYQTQYLDQDNINSWKGGLSQYDIWAGEVELDTYPENYIDPTLRQSQTAYFKDLLTDLNQNTINNDTAQQAVMNYLNKFEQVANLTIVSGYLDSTDQTSGIYYFLGKSSTSPVQYYWRSFDMSKNVDNVVSTDAWSEWYPMNTTISEDNLQGIPRLAYFNNRLYLFWFEKTTGGNVTGVTDGSTYDIITAYLSYCDFNNNWVAPTAIMVIDNDPSKSEENDYTKALFDSANLNTVAIYNVTYNIITISLYDGKIEGESDEDAELAGYSDFTINIDYWIKPELTQAKSADGISVNQISKILFQYLENDERVGKQKIIQAKASIGAFIIGGVALSGAEHDDFDGKLSLPSIDISNFSLQEESNGQLRTIVKYPDTLDTRAADAGGPWFIEAFIGQEAGTWEGDDNIMNEEEWQVPPPPDKYANIVFNIEPDDERLDSDSFVEYISIGYHDNYNSAPSNTADIYQEYSISYVKTVTTTVAPVITSKDDPLYGNTIYLQFTGNFANDTVISPIRLNTLFSKELINKANVSISDLLSWDTQLTLEPGMTDDNAVPMDFSGANGIYFWELFFYMPYLVAWRLSQEEEYSDALSWYNYIFDPSARGRDNSSTIRQQYPEPDYWSVRPLVESASSAAQASAVWLTTDPDALAKAYPVHYQKAVFMAYVSTLIAAADASYRLLTNDGLSLARLQYGQVKDLLGIRPDSLIVNHWAPETLAELAESAGNNVALLNYEQQAPALPAFAGQPGVAADVTTSDNFMAPVNSQLLNYWNTLDSRLYNLRHQLTIDGQPMSVPLYAPPVNPTVLMEQSVQGGSLISASSGMTATIPPYRFTTMLQSARAAAATLSQFGQTLLSYYERKDAAGLQELDAQLALNISAYTLTLGQNAIDAMDQDKTVLESSRSMAQQRYDHYFGLYSNGVSAGETSAMALRDSASASMTAASPLITAGMAMRTIPNIFGLADGGEEVGAPTLAAGIVLQLTGEITGLAAQQTDISESYRRRSEEWQIQYQQAQSEVDTLNAQLDALAVRRQGAVTSLQLAQAQQDNLKSTLNFLTTRFTQSSLYNWLSGQLSALYYQAYDAVLSLCLSAQASWQYEMGDITSTFIQTGAWNDSYHGLLVGETLTLNLQQMESAWLSRNERRLELTKTISLKELDGDAFSSLVTDGKTQFSLKEALFDNDYPGHYLRQIKFVTVSLPALVGPYQDVRMTLTQSGSSTLLKADINGVNYLNDSTKGSASNVITNLRASQQIAVSSGLNDSGMFVLNFGDERYLPFEGTGAISSWQISFPNATSDEQQALLASLNDVIIQVHYTAVYGGSTFEQSVIGTL